MKFIYFFIATLISFSSYCQNTITIEKKIYFEHNQFNLTAEAFSSLDSLVNVSNKYAVYNIKIIGYTDSSGSLQYNKKLSGERAKTVFDYLIEKKLNQLHITHQGYGVDNQSKNDTIQRNTTVTFTAKIEDSYYKLNSITSKNGTEVSMRIRNQPNADFSLEEYFTAQSMILNEKFALDINDEVLETAGMIDIDLKNINPDDIEDGKIQIAIPTFSNADYDEEMTVWIEETDKNGKRRWKNLKLKPKWNKNSKRYEFEINVSNFRNNKISINLDKYIYRDQLANVSTGKDKKVIVVATENDELYYDVYLSYTNEQQNNLKFSAKMDKTGFAFVIPKKVNPKNLLFTGVNSSGKESFSLSSCKVSKYKNKYTLYRFVKVPHRDFKKVETTEKKGFWEWLKRIFN